MGAVVVLTWGKNELEGGAGVGCDHVQLGGQPAPGASYSLGSAFFEGACSVGVDLDRGAVQPQDLYVDDALVL